MSDAQLILASGSPRRHELLSLTGIHFEVDAPEVDEHTDLGAREAVMEISRRKALAGYRAHPHHVILAADTLVALNNQPLGKPADAEDAFRMLRALAGRWHQVFTGVACVDAEGGMHVGLDTSDVRFCEMTDEQIRSYIATGEPMDKAGAYALQGIASLFIEEVRGTPSGVMGLPMQLTRRLLAECHVTIPIRR